MSERCERTVHEFKKEYSSAWPNIKETPCHHCGKKLEKTFEYCPFCGTHISR